MLATRAGGISSQLGVVSGIALDLILARRLQDGDPGGHMRRGLDRLPFPKMAERIWQKYYIPGDKSENEPYMSLPQHPLESPRELLERQQKCLKVLQTFCPPEFRLAYPAYGRWGLWS